MKVHYNLIFRLCILFFSVLFTWFFPHIILYIFLAFILAMMGKPIAKALSSIKLFKRSIPYGVSSVITMSVFLVVLVLSILLFVPVFIQELRVIENINYDILSQNLTPLVNNIQQFLYDNNLMDNQTTIVGFFTAEIKNLLSMQLFSNIVGGVVSTTGSFVFGFFAVFFMGFFFIKDDFKLEKALHLLMSKKYHYRITVVSNKIDKLLSRYFLGTILRIAIITILLYVGMLLFGIRGALFLGFLGGILNIIPYLGPIIGIIIACLFGFIDCVSAEMYSDILAVQLKILGVFVGANVIDNLVLQPYIYSQSVKIHPIEVFLVTIIGGDMAGISGMIFAIPVYTIVRVSVREIYNYVNRLSLKADKKINNSD